MIVCGGCIIYFISIGITMREDNKVLKADGHIARFSFGTLTTYAFQLAFHPPSPT